MLFDAGQVASVTGVRVVAVYFGVEHAFYLVVVRIAVGKAVGHQQVKGVRSVEAFMFASFHGACLQLVFLYGFLLTLYKSQGNLAGLYVLVQFQIDQQVVIALQLDDTA